MRDYAYIAIGYSCNHSCIFCPCSKDIPKKTRLSTEQIINSVETAIKNKNLRGVLLSGGEPTLQPHFFEVLEYLSKTNLSIGMLSNSDKLHDKALIDKIVSIIPPERFRITTSIHSHIPENHDSVTRSSGSFARSLSGLKNAVEAGININIKHCITKLNYMDMVEFVEFVYSNFPDNAMLNMCSIDYCGVAGDNNSIVAVCFSESGPFIEQALDRVIEYSKNGWKRQVIVDDTPLCAVDPYYWAFFSNTSKDMLAAYSDPNGDEKTSVLRFDVASDCGTFFPSCKTCDVESLCSGTWRTACELFGDSAVSPIKSCE